LEPCLELVFNLSEPIICIVDDYLPITISEDFIIGSLARQIQIKPTGSMFLFGVKFTPEGLYPFLSMPPVDLSDICVEIEEVWELNQLGSSQLIHSTNPTAENLIQTFEGFFSRRMNNFREKHGLNVEKAVTIIRSHKGQILVETLAKRLQISSRHLERKFTKLLGVPPKQLCRIFRIKNILVHLKTTECYSASFAVASGYFDQAHFIHEFKYFTGKSPLIYLAGGRSPNKTTTNFNS
jgi:AraC-like DNA-binding protein